MSRLEVSARRLLPWRSFPLTATFFPHCPHYDLVFFPSWHLSLLKLFFVFMYLGFVWWPLPIRFRENSPPVLFHWSLCSENLERCVACGLCSVALRCLPLFPTRAATSPSTGTRVLGTSCYFSLGSSDTDSATISFSRGKSVLFKLASGALQCHQLARECHIRCDI